MNKNRILLITDDSLTQKSMYEMLCRSGYEADTANSLKNALARLDESLCNIILLDVDGGIDALKLIKTVKDKSYPAEIITLTSYGRIDTVPRHKESPVYECLVRPLEDDRIISVIKKALSAKSLISPRPVLAKTALDQKDVFYGLVGKSPIMKDVYSLIERISNSKATVLLRGESGTGKRLIAHAIHKADKKRHDKPFMEVSCGALPREIIESELFGHTKGSFTGAINDRKGRFELANGGTILLDDIDSFSPDLQVKLLRVLQHKEFDKVGDHKTTKVDVRIVVTTNQDLEKIVAEKKFREDLYYRLNVISINIPPLRSRKDDLPFLVHHFITLFAEENNKAIEGISEDALESLVAYDWPGNIRELENIIERAVILDTDGVLEKDDLPEIITNGNTILTEQSLAGITAGILPLKDALKEPEKLYILQVLKEVGWNKNKAARKLGVNRTTLYNKLKKYNLVDYLDGGKSAQ